MAEKSRILVIGGTGYVGQFIVGASARIGHPTFLLVRDAAPSDPSKSEMLDEFKSSGVNFLHGDLFNHDSLVLAIKQVDIVISAVGSSHIPHQVNIIAAIKEAGNIKRFYPSEYGNDVDRVHAVEPVKSVFAAKARIRRAIEAEGIPHTYISSNFLDGYFLPTLSQPDLFEPPPPREKAIVLGDGIPKAVFNFEEDVGTYTVRSVDDPRALNKTIYVRPPGNIYSFNDLLSLWERKIGKTLEKKYIPEPEVLKMIEESPPPVNSGLALCYSAYVKGDHTSFEIEPSLGLEASELYPDVQYTTVDEYLNQFV